jgi:NAD(P)-dependent dehydrogenase (short-subunit alcohol dehydrogenase family)
MSNRLESKVALVTGGGNGIGEAISHRFAEEGATVVVTDYDQESAVRVAAAIKSAGGQAISFQQDVADEQRWADTVDAIVESFARLDILVNNAGIGITGDVEETTLADWRKMQSVNMESVLVGTQTAIKVMKGTGGSIINISSIAGMVGNPLWAGYSASKGAVRLFTKSAALHCAGQDYGIRINSVHPGFIDTAMVAGALASVPESERAALLESVKANIPLKRYGAPVDVANGCVFLASDESTYMTGSELVIDGGYTAR